MSQSDPGTGDRAQPDSTPRDGVQRDRGILLGRFRGIPIYLSPSWLIIAALITYLFGPVVASRLPGIGTWAYVVAFVFAALLNASVLVHELSHSLVALHFGLPVRRISLYLLGGLSEIEREPQTPGREFAVAIAGPVVSIGLGLLGWGLVEVLPQGTLASLLAYQLMIANLLVGMFNLLPGLPLDGGVVLKAVVWQVSGRRHTGTFVAAYAGRGLAVLVVLAPMALATARGTRADLFDVVWGFLLASFIWAGAGQALANAKLRQRLPALSLRALTRRAVPVTGDVPLSEALRRLGEAGAMAIVVVDPNDRAVAVVNEDAVRATPEHRRPWVPTSDVARRLHSSVILRADLGGEALLRAIQDKPAPEYLVVEPTGSIYGVLARADVERALVAA